MGSTGADGNEANVVVVIKASPAFFWPFWTPEIFLSPLLGGWFCHPIGEGGLWPISI